MPADLLADGRYLARERHDQYERARLAAVILAQAEALTIPIVLACGRPARLGALGLVACSAIVAFFLWRTVAYRLRRLPGILGILVGAVATASAMSLDILEPDLHTLVVGYLTMIPLASTILLFWRPPTHLAALAAFYGSTILFVLLSPPSLELAERATILALTGAACLLSVFGNLEGTLRRNSRARQARQLRSQRLELRLIARERAREARTDALTGLGSRRALHEDLAAAQERARASDRRTAVALLDVDHFKAFNDRHGHRAGDGLLERIGSAIRSGLRQGDVAYRYGGEEFLILLEDASADQAEAVVGRIRSALDAAGIEHPGNPPWKTVTFSAGVAEVNLDRGISVEAALRLADHGLYAAKAQGRNRTVTESSESPQPDG
jgi:diguanylate cyclase (GGDEF)-like protein